MLVRVPFQFREEDGTVRCGICPQNCRVKPFVTARWLGIHNRTTPKGFTR